LHGSGVPLRRYLAARRAEPLTGWGKAHRVSSRRLTPMRGPAICHHPAAVVKRLSRVSSSAPGA